MPFKYQIKQNAGDSHQSKPHWLMCVVRFAQPDTFDRSSNDILSVSKDIDPMEEAPPLVLDNDVLEWSIQNQKSSHMSSGSFVLSPASQVIERVFAGDWVLFWAFDNEEDQQRVLEKVKKKERANLYGDGLKFVGRVNGVKRNRSTDQGGVKKQAFHITAMGFREFDSTIYYNEALSAGRYGRNLNLWAIDFAGTINNFILTSRKNKGVTPGEAITALVPLLMGTGPGGTSGIKYPDGLDSKIVDLLRLSPNQAMLIPKTVGQLLLGETFSSTKDSLAYSDIIRVTIGIQHYLNSSISVDRASFSTPESFLQYQPISLRDMIGNLFPWPLHFGNTSVWSILQGYLNEPINEMYTCLRVDEDGYIMPSFMARQTPYSSNLLAGVRGGIRGAENKATPVTAFTSLPRWVLDPSMALGDDLGQSDSLKFNYIHLPITAPSIGPAGKQYQESANYARNPPFVDRADISRSGLRMFHRGLSIDIVEATLPSSGSPGRDVTQIMADFMLGQHLRWSGTVACKGLQDPIAEGDNLEYDGCVYHLEGIIHRGKIDAMGKKNFSTDLQVTMGISVESDNSEDPVYPGRTTRALLRPEDGDTTDFRRVLDVFEPPSGASFSVTDEVRDDDG